MEEESLDGEGDTIVLYVSPADIARHSRDSGGSRYSSYRSKGSFQAKNDELLSLMGKMKEGTASRFHNNRSVYSQHTKASSSLWSNK